MCTCICYSHAGRNDTPLTGKPRQGPPCEVISFPPARRHAVKVRGRNAPCKSGAAEDAQAMKDEH